MAPFAGTLARADLAADSGGRIHVLPCLMHFCIELSGEFQCTAVVAENDLPLEHDGI